MVYYLGTDGDAPLTSPWSKDAPAFYVRDVEDPEREFVKGKLPHRRVVYIGSHQGCGCGFRSYRDGYLIESDAEQNATTADHAALAAYLEALPPSAGPIQIFACWSGDESDPVEYHRDFTVSDLIDSQFGFREREMLTLKP